MSQCCCGRFKELDEPIIINDKMHEPLGREGAFCGPFINHQLRSALNTIDSLKSERNDLVDVLENFVNFDFDLSPFEEEELAECSASARKLLERIKSNDIQ